MSVINNLIRKNIKELKPYSSARNEYSGEDAIFMDANENPFNNSMNRYPDPLQVQMKKNISALKNVAPDCIFTGNGSDEAIDLLMRAFCEPGIDNIISIRPTYGMYKVCADINNIQYKDALLTPDLQIDARTMLQLSDSNSKLMILCSPNNPTSNSLKRDDILLLINRFAGLVIVDEAYIDFSGENSLLDVLDKYPNLVILQTFSKAWGMAGVRLGMAFAGPEIIRTLNKIKYPYNINVLTQKKVIERLDMTREKENQVKRILEQRELLCIKLGAMDLTEGILPSDSNFLMVRFKEPARIFSYLMERKIILRDRSKIPLCEGCLRITVGTKEENEELLKALEKYPS